jgi:hypothetical protein
VSAAGTLNGSTSALSAGQTYYWHTMHEDAAGNQSAVVSSAQITTTSLATVALSLKTTDSNGNTVDVANADFDYAIRNSGTALSAAADVSGSSTTNGSGDSNIEDSGLSGPVRVTVEITSGTYSGRTLHLISKAVN